MVLMARIKFKLITEALLDFSEIAIIGVTVFFLVYIFVGQLLEVSGDSMLPTLYNNEQIVAEKISLAFKPLEHGEIVIFRHPEMQNRLLIKRVIALPGDEIMLSEGKVVLNGEILNENYTVEGSSTNGSGLFQDLIKYTIPEHTYFLLGDNREESSDSRSFGAISEELIMGRALVVYKPLKNFRVIEH